jgi:glycosyltransferase involved in cell wall biosynthesis
MKRLRVLVLPSIPYAPYRRSYKPGIGPDPWAFTRALAADGVDVDMLDPTGFPLNPFAGKHPLLQSIDPFRSIAVLLGRRNYDLVVSGNEGAAVLLVLLRRWFRFHPPVLVWDLAPATRWRWRARLQDRILPKVDGILALNAIQEPYIAERWGSHIPVNVIGPLVDAEFYRPVAEPSGDGILSVGDDAGRDYDTLLKAVAGLQIPTLIKTSIRLVIDPAEHHHVKLVRERLPPLGFRELYANARFIVLPLMPDTRNASGVSTLLESAAMGKAAIVSDSDGIRDFVVPGETCLTVPGRDPSALRAAIERLYNEPETCLRLGHNARRFVKEQFAIIPTARRFATALRSYVR